MPAIVKYQIACEGRADEVFYSRLLRESGKNVGVHCPEPSLGYGISSINHVLVSFQTQYDAIKRIVVLVDADDDREASFEKAQEQIAISNQRNPLKRFAVPDTANTFFELAGAPEIAIVVLPLTGRGCLDTLLLPSFEQKFGASLKCVDEYCNCVKDPNRGFTRDSKIRLRILIATVLPKEPGKALSYMLEKAKDCPVPLSHQSFDETRDFLVGLFPE